MDKEIIEIALSRYESRAGQALNLRGVLFDMDGVLYDSMPSHERSWLETAETYGLPMTQEDVYMFEGQTGPQTIDVLYARKCQRRASPEEIKDIYALKTELFNQYNTGALIPYVDVVLSKVKHLKPVIVTGSSQASLLDKLSDNFPGIFSADKMVTGLDVKNGKPNPEPYIKGMLLSQTEPWETVVVENAPAGVRSASTAGCFTIAVNTGPLLDERLWSEGADIVLRDMQELAGVLDYLLSK